MTNLCASCTNVSGFHYRSKGQVISSSNLQLLLHASVVRAEVGGVMRWGWGREGIEREGDREEKKLGREM